MSRAVALHQAGSLEEAERIYRAVLDEFPRNAAALHLLGIVHAQRGDAALAVTFIGNAIRADATNPAFHFNLGKAQRQLHRPREAIAALEQALALDPLSAEVANELGLVHLECGDLTRAEAAFRRALSSRTGYFDAQSNLGLTQHRKGEQEAAVGTLTIALQWRPGAAEALNNLGMALRALGRTAEALDAYRAAHAASPGHAVILKNLGNALLDADRVDEAVACFSRAAAIDPDFDEIHIGWGLAHLRRRELVQAGEKFSRALQINPTAVEAMSGLGSVLQEQNRLEDALRYFRQALGAQPDHSEIHSKLLFCLLHVPDQPPDMIFAEHRDWAIRHAARWSNRPRVHRNCPDPERRLRIGYVSADFRSHAVSFFFEPVLTGRHAGEFEVFCYYNGIEHDEVTRRISAASDHFIDAARMNDDALAARIEEDCIDVLVDLSGHTRGNRLLAFARRPAPVQATWLGYPNTTGMAAMDYRLTDSIADPPQLTDAWYAETLVRLPDSLCCYRAHGSWPDVAPSPAHASGFVRFVSLNSHAKIGPRVIAAWARVLLAVPRSGLTMIRIDDPGDRVRLLRSFADQGVDAGRIEFESSLDTQTYRNMFRQWDICLDAFPLVGGTTSCDALWMGLPVVSLAGRTFLERVGASWLTGVGHPEWIAGGVDAYVGIARALASDTAKLAAIRAALRPAMHASPLMDSARFCRGFEAALRQMWQRWCRMQTRQARGR